MNTNDEIMNLLLKIDKRLDKIEEILLVTKNASNKMSNHIDFIDNIYDIIKKPFYKILSINNNNLNIDKIKRLR